MSSTLISGKRDAVLVDTFIIIEQAGALVDWVAASGKKLTTIYAMHGHGDHFFGIGALLDRFLNARAVATPDVVKLMRQQASPDVLANFWNAFFPGQIPDRVVIAEEHTGNVMDLEEHEWVTVPLGHTDIETTPCRPPSLDHRPPPENSSIRCLSSMQTGSIGVHFWSSVRYAVPIFKPRSRPKCH